jgi:hypothetical protein
LQANKEQIMDKRNEVHAVDAENLVFESNFGQAEALAIQFVQVVAKRPQWMPAWSAAALAWEHLRTDDTTDSPVVH